MIKLFDLSQGRGAITHELSVSEDLGHLTNGPFRGMISSSYDIKAIAQRLFNVSPLTRGWNLHYFMWQLSGAVVIRKYHLNPNIWPTCLRLRLPLPATCQLLLFPPDRQRDQTCACTMGDSGSIRINGGSRPLDRSLVAALVTCLQRQHCFTAQTS